MKTRDDRIRSVRRESSKYLYQNKNGIPKAKIPCFIFDDNEKLYSFDEFINIDIIIEDDTINENDQLFILICTKHDQSNIRITQSRLRTINTYESWLYFCLY